MIEIIIKFMNAIIKGLGSILNGIVSILPDSPFVFIDNSVIKDYLGYINYFAPITEIIVILELWIIAIGTYYLYQIILRWIKAIN